MVLIHIEMVMYLEKEINKMIIEEYDKRETGRQENTFTLQQILEYIDVEDIIWFRYGQRVSAKQ